MLIFLVEVGLRAQNAIWNFGVPDGIISNTFKLKIFLFSCCLSFTALDTVILIPEKSLITLAVKILIPFIILGARPTSTLGPKRDQLVWVNTMRGGSPHTRETRYCRQWHPSNFNDFLITTSWTSGPKVTLTSPFLPREPTTPLYKWFVEHLQQWNKFYHFKSQDVSWNVGNEVG